MSEEDDYELVLTALARRALADRLPESVAVAVIDFLTTSLIQSPRRVGLDEIADPIADSVGGGTTGE